MYLSTWSESGINMSAPNYLHVECMRYLYMHCLKIGIETLKPNVFLFVKYTTIIIILFIDSMSKPNVLFQA